MKLRPIVVGLVLSLAAAPIVAAEPTLSFGAVMDAVEHLRPGEFFWIPQVAPEGPLLVIASLATQRAIVYRNGVPIGVTTISTGRPGHETPTGVFTILQKRAEHYSNLYDNAPMPFMQSLTWGGIALHAGNLPGFPASHGCIRLPRAFAEHLFQATSLGTTVVVTDDAAVPRLAPSPELFRFDGAGSRVTEVETDFWRPELAPNGPVSIVVSATDGRIVVLRNGVMIGSASAVVQRSVDGTTVHVLDAIDETGRHWLRIPLPGATATPTPIPSTSGESPVEVSESFRSEVVPILRPGTTVIVTADTLVTRTFDPQPTPLLETD